MTDPQTGRMRWADVAKGVCIVLVVLWHVTRKDYLQLPWDLGVPVTGAWGQISEVLLPVRMPLFFLISGLFAARQLDRPWARVWSGRVAPVLYLFVLWTLVHTVVLQLTPGFDTAVADGPLDLLVQLTVTPGNLWYLLALAAYVVVARGTRRVPHGALAAALLLSAVAAAGVVPTPGNRYGLLTNLVWFLLGTRVPRLGPVVGRLTRPRARTVVVAVAAFAVGAVAWQALGAGTWFGVRPVLGLLGIAAGTAVASVVSLVPRWGEVLAGLGRQTLPVYVLHLPLVALVHLGSARLVGEGSWAAGSLPLALGYPVVVSVVVVTACLTLHRLLVAAGAGWLFVAPWLTAPQRQQRRAARAPAG
ncbi:acyltransferase family protein [Nocardioides sp.]|uniref:acyltransferase family protein n=1 Tax=Nocardioides sp. TaxID=35761 RepID=UPI002717C3C2|nr:acyltransferase family protein [Nocardioides sp.]MDO9458159.1 acyltransferase family protein [Nocardioides sp.]